MGKDYEAFHRYDFLTRELLYKEYIEDGLTDSQIAKKYNMPSKVVVWNKRKKFGIQNKLPNKSNKNAKINKIYLITYEELKKLRDDGIKIKDIAKMLNCAISVITRRLKEFDLVKEKTMTVKYEFYNINLNHNEKQVILGSVLGDSYLTISNALANIHSTKQSEYFFHFMNKISRINNGKFQYIEGIDTQGNPTTALQFRTGCNKFIEEIKPIYYVNGVKIFPYEFLINNLEEEGLAYWYMDDGSWDFSSSVVSLHTQGFILDYVEKAKDFFINKYNLCPSIIESKREIFTYRQFYLRFNKKNSKSFIDLVNKYIPECMQYKTGNIQAYANYKKIKEEYIKDKNIEKTKDIICDI